ncbi:unnamed protein product [Rhizophagus irregularis]|nr:unnamed protein product [Rhizophagus irregularis]
MLIGKLNIYEPLQFVKFIDYSTSFVPNFRINDKIEIKKKIMAIKRKLPSRSSRFSKIPDKFQDNDDQTTKAQDKRSDTRISKAGIVLSNFHKEAGMVDQEIASLLLNKNIGLKKQGWNSIIELSQGSWNGGSRNCFPSAGQKYCLKKQGWNGIIELSQGSIVQLEWWNKKLLLWNERILILEEPKTILYTDASFSGWGVSRLSREDWEDCVIHGRSLSSYQRRISQFNIHFSQTYQQDKGTQYLYAYFKTEEDLGWAVTKGWKDPIYIEQRFYKKNGSTTSDNAKEKEVIQIQEDEVTELVNEYRSDRTKI